MTYKNGQFPLSALSRLGWDECDHLYLRADAAASLNKLAAKFHSHFGRPLYLSDAYRDYPTQVRLKKQKGSFAATPGTSNHGWGVAIDAASNVNVDTSAEHRWFENWGPYFGWINPTWATDRNPANGQYEPWHWEYVPTLDRSRNASTTTTEDDDMSAAAEAAIARIEAMTRNLEAAVVHGGASMPGGLPIRLLLDDVNREVDGKAAKIPLRQEIADAKTIIMEVRDLIKRLPTALWVETTVARGIDPATGQAIRVPVIQELADAKTFAMAAAGTAPSAAPEGGLSDADIAELVEAFVAAVPATIAPAVVEALGRKLVGTP